MKLNKTILKLFILLLISFFISNSLYSQKQQQHPEKQALFIYNFFKFVKWPNLKKLESFNVGVIGDKDNLVYTELIKIAKTNNAKGLPIKVKRLNSLNELEDVQLLYFDKSASLSFNKIYAAIGARHILLVSKGYPYGKSMINFIMDEDNVQYELNESKCASVGLKASRVLSLVAVKSEKQWNAILNKYENLAKTNNETVEISTKELNKVVKEQKRLLNEISTNTKKIKAQKNKLKEQQEVLSVKENELINTEKDIEIQQNVIIDQLEKIYNQKTNLDSLNQNIKFKQDELTQQQKELDREALSLIEIQKEYEEIELALKKKELLVNIQGKTISKQGDEITVKSDKIEKQKTIIWLSIIFLLIISALGIMAYRSYRLKNKANIQIINQKERIEGQHKEITDSINYAKRIQEAIMPPSTMIEELLPDSFILYEPKDIVAGDFYWLESKKVNDSSYVLFAAADCTGHGVPGAMVSIVCNNAMNRAVREFNLIEPNKILEKTRNLVLETFERSAEEINDGMDIAMCTLNTKTRELSYAGANNGLYLIREGELTEIKPDKQPIGKYNNVKLFTNHKLDLKKGDVIYTFSDGYVDQFGGVKGKKFMYKPFRKLLIEIHSKPMQEQHKILLNTFETWKGDLEQVDDLCIIGVRV